MVPIASATLNSLDDKVQDDEEVHSAESGFLPDEGLDSSLQADRTSIAANDSIVAYPHVLNFTFFFKLNFSEFLKAETLYP